MGYTKSHSKYERSRAKARRHRTNEKRYHEHVLKKYKHSGDLGDYSSFCTFGDPQKTYPTRDDISKAKRIEANHERLYRSHQDPVTGERKKDIMSVC